MPSSLTPIEVKALILAADAMIVDMNQNPNEVLNARWLEPTKDALLKLKQMDDEAETQNNVALMGICLFAFGGMGFVTDRSVGCACVATVGVLLCLWAARKVKGV